MKVRKQEKQNVQTPLHPPTNRGVTLPHPTKLAYCKGWDWVEFTAHKLSLEELPKQTKNFRFEHSKMRSKNYSSIFEVYVTFKGVELQFATLQLSPRVDFIPQDLVQIKIDNNFCYSSNLINYIKMLLTQLDLKFKNFTRLDCFIDFQETQYLTPQKILNNLSSREITVKNKRNISSYINDSCVNTVQLGSASSDVTVCLYNKTKEMQKKTTKPWISQMWLDAGFDENKHTYRLEFRSKKTLKDIVNIQGETLGSFVDLNFLNAVSEYIDYNVSYHFQTAITRGNSRFSRLHQIQILDLKKSSFSPQTPSIREKSNNYNKAYVRKMSIDALFLQKQGDLYQSSALFNHVSICLQRWNLESWFFKKINVWLEVLDVQSLLGVMTYEYMKTSRLKQSNLFDSKQDYVPIKPLF